MSAQPIQLRRRTLPEQLEYLADQLDKALDSSDPAGASRVRSVQLCLISLAAEYTEATAPDPP